MADETNSSSEHEAVVTFPVRDLLQQIRTEQATGFARVEANLTTKADKADVARLEMRLDQHGNRLHTLESWRREEKVAESVLEEHTRDRGVWRRRIIGAVGTILLILATLFSAYFGTHPPF